jgi:hypothetical protein
MNFLNSPPGPLGQAGQSSTSTQPNYLFNNASPQFSKFGQGAQKFGERIAGAPGKAQDVLSRLFGNLFGGQGDLAQPQPQGFPGQGEPVQGGFPGQGAPVAGTFPGQGQGPLAGVLGGQGQSITGPGQGPGQGTGILNRFMQNG